MNKEFVTCLDHIIDLEKTSNELNQLKWLETFKALS